MDRKLILLLSVVLLLDFCYSLPANFLELNPIVMCKLPERKGHCRALLPRYRYDADSGKCSEFKFGGCDGNGNNFETYKDCMDMCSGI